jgi:TusA-related sulfurtransferase
MDYTLNGSGKVCPFPAVTSPRASDFEQDGVLLPPAIGSWTTIDLD